MYRQACFTLGCYDEEDKKCRMMEYGADAIWRARKMVKDKGGNSPSPFCFGKKGAGFLQMCGRENGGKREILYR